MHALCTGTYFYVLVEIYFLALTLYFSMQATIFLITEYNLECSLDFLHHEAGLLSSMVKVIMTATGFF